MQSCVLTVGVQRRGTFLGKNAQVVPQEGEGKKNPHTEAAHLQPHR